MAAGPCGLGSDMRMHQALYAARQWQGRSVHKDLAERMGLCHDSQRSVECNRWLNRYLSICYHRRCHVGLKGRIPYQQFSLLRTNE